jgi:two-component system NtrC family sensor kinase
MPAPHAAAAAPPAQNGPSVAAIPARRSLRTRVALFAALAIGLVIGIAIYLQARVFERTVEDGLVDTARLTTLAVADDLELRGSSITAEEMHRTLREFIDAVPELRSISVVMVEGGAPVIFASTSSAESAEALAVARRAIERREVVWGRPTGPLRTLAAPLQRDASTIAAVTVTVSFASLYRLRDTGRSIAVWSTVIAVGVLFVLVELLARWFIHRPIDAIRATMSEVAGGALGARAPVIRHDEIGAVAMGLNAMLGEMHDLHTGLQRRIAQSTVDLRTRNRELLDMYQQMFQLREELGRAQQLAAVGETTSTVAHQIGTPLNLVSGHIQVLIEEQGPDSPVTRRLQIAEEQIRKVTAIVASLLDRSRRDLDRAPADLAQLLGRLCALVQPALESAGVRLTFETEPAAPIDADVAQLELALLNLISNALDAMPHGGRLMIRVTSHTDHVSVAVTDTGVGVPAALVERIFEPWVTTKPPGEGTGLGLSIARRVVVEHGGRISVRSEEGSGSTFVVELPIRGVPARDEAAHA